MGTGHFPPLKKGGSFVFFFFFLGGGGKPMIKKPWTISGGGV